MRTVGGIVRPTHRRLPEHRDKAIRVRLNRSEDKAERRDKYHSARRREAENGVLCTGRTRICVRIIMSH